MRQLDLFGSFLETVPQENKPEEKAAVSKNQEERSMVSEAIAPSYSKNALRSERPVDVSIKDKAPENETEKQGTNAPVNPPLTAPASVLLSLFDSPQTAEEIEPVQETEVIITEAAAEMTTTEEHKKQDTTGSLQPLNTEESESGITEQLKTFPQSVIEEHVIDVEERTATQKPKKQNTPEPERNGSVIFDDGKISVKIKNKSPLPSPNAKEKKEKVKKVPQKRGRKSFKEIDAEADIIEIPEDEVLFQKQYYPISEVAKWFRVNTSLLRFWENEFDVLKPRKNRKGDRLFRPEDVKNLQLIYQLLRQRKYTIEGAKEYIKTNKKKADIQLQLTNTLQKFKSFLLDMRANLQP